MVHLNMSKTRLLCLGLFICIVSWSLSILTSEADQAASGAEITSAPLAERAASESQKFVALTAEETNLDFVHKWTPPEHDYDFRTLLNGGAVCLGDYDGDGLADVYLTRPAEGNRLYRNLGNWKFEDVTEQAGLVDDSWGMGATFVDIDNDGDLDIYACAFQSPNRLFINQGDGTFDEQAKDYGLDYNGASIMMSMADYDNDGWLDGYLLTNRRQPKSHKGLEKRVFEGYHVTRQGAYFEEELREFMGVISTPDGVHRPIMTGQLDLMFHNTGEGKFEDVSKRCGITGYDIGLAATWWDYNRDGLADLYVANDFFGPDRLYRNEGGGNFADVSLETLPHTPWSSMGADVADINNDGLLDFIGSDMSARGHYRSKVTMGDMSDANWFLDWAEPRQFMRNAVFVNSGTERFLESAMLSGMSSTDWTWSVKLADLDDDGRVDAYFTNGMTRDWENADLEGEANKLGGYHSPEGKAFWMKQPPNKRENLAYHNKGDLKFESIGADWGLDHNGVTFGAALGDLDGDGDLDLVANNYEEAVSVYRNDASSGHRVKIRLVGTKSNRWGIGATVYLENGAGKQVRYLTLARGIMSADEPLVHFGLGEQETIDRLTVHWPSGHVQKFENLKADQFYTITEPQTAVPERKEEEAPTTLFTKTDSLKEARHREDFYDDFLRQPLLPNKLSQMGPGIAWGDLNGDGLDDLYLAGAAGHSGEVYRNLGNGEYESTRGFLADTAADADRVSEDMGVLMFDYDADGDLDVYVVSGGVECEAEAETLKDRLYVNDGQGNLAKADEGVLPDLRDSGGVVCAADFDRDGDLDLFVGGRFVPGQYPVTPLSRLLRNDEGIFNDATTEVAPEVAESGLVTSALWSDANGDGWIDLLVTYDWGPVKVFLNEEGRLADRTEEAGLADRLGWFNGIAGRDLDGDGDIDYVVTNTGLNTKYKASKKKPSRIYYGDFEGTGEMHIVEAKMYGDKMLPVRGKSCSQNAMPFLSQKFPKYHDFAISSLSDIYTPTCLDESLTVEVNNLETGMLINDGQAQFTFHALPTLAQISPGFGVVLTEVNGDGKTDICIAQNFYHPQRETGRMAGGVSLVMLGNGDGTFATQWPSESGVVVPADAKSLAVTDINNDGWQDLVVGVNDNHVHAFLNNGTAGQSIVRVKLKGKAGNSQAVGARVTAEYASGASQTAEVSAGGSYLSQSSADLVFGLPSADEISRVIVRWPDGSETTHTESDESVEISVHQSPAT